MKVGLIGQGAIARYVMAKLEGRGHVLGAVLVRPTRVSENPSLYVGSVQELPNDLDLMIDCAGHTALIDYGAAILSRGMDLVTVSLGALADSEVKNALDNAAKQGCARLHLASGAIGALDCLQAARSGQLDRVKYIGRKPPKGWKGSRAEDAIDLDALNTGATIHFQGNARDAALKYPKNANVAAAVALAGIGFDGTEVELIADADIADNIHEIEANGAFGHFRFQISGQSLPDNPRSSALAAMSVLSKLDQITRTITL